MLSSSHIFYYAYSICYSNLNEKLKKKFLQNKCIRFCLKLDKRHHISNKDFESINWFPIFKRVHQCISAVTFKLVNMLELVIWMKFMSSPLKRTIMQIEKALINDHSRVSKVSWRFCIPTIYNFAVIYRWNLLFS